MESPLTLCGGNSVRATPDTEGTYLCRNEYYEAAESSSR